MPPPLGFIEPENRTAEQNAAHAAALSTMSVFALPPVTTAGPVKVMLPDFLKDPDVVVDMGMEFPGFRQVTGSCVGVSEGNGTAVLSAVQRKLADNPTLAFIPWWPFAYGRTRYQQGDRRPGEGAVVSVMGKVLEEEGTFASTEDGLPQYRIDDGLVLDRNTELEWSDGDSSTVMKWMDVGKRHRFGARAVIHDTQSIKSAILNGYPVLNGCRYFIGNGKITGSGDDRYVRGEYDGRGGHATGFHGYWDHPNDGPLFLYWNTWDVRTYPLDPAGGPRCSVWVPEKIVNRRIQDGSIQYGEMFAISHVDYFPAQVDKILDFTQI